MSRLVASTVELRRITEASEFGRVAVLLGGDSSEREISLRTGQAVLDALLRKGIAAEPFDPAVRALPELLGAGFDRVWIALHGPGGEDGTVQGALEYLGVPYTGSGVLGSALCMDKLRTKRVLEASGFATPRYVELGGEEDFDAAVTVLGLPMIVKPASQGSSVGMTKVERHEELPGAYASARAVESTVFAESWITGGEYTAAILQNEALPLIRIETPRSFYDYEAKYFRDDTRYHCPCGLPAEDEERLRSTALGAFRAVAAEGWGRVDFMLTAGGEPLVLEVNTVPGMTDHSLVPMAARARGIDFDELAWRVLETSFSRICPAGRRGV